MSSFFLISILFSLIQVLIWADDSNKSINNNNTINNNQEINFNNQTLSEETKNLMN